MINQNIWDPAQDVVASAHDPLAAKLFFWLYYSRKSENISFVRLTQFIRQNPEWPGIGSLRLKAEKNIPENIPPQDIISWFDDHEPLTAEGVDRYVEAILKTGNDRKARSYLAKWWANTPLSRDDQRTLFRKYNRYMNTAVHHKRLDMLLFKGQYENALAIADVLQKGYPELAKARIALAQEKGDVNALIANVPRNLQSDPGLIYERIRWRRKNDMNTAAIELLQNSPPIEKIQNPDDWWLERHIIIRRLLEQKSYRAAYVLASTHSQKPGGLPFAQAEWMAGWLSLRFLNDPMKAFQHFQLLYSNVSTPVSKSRGAYWAGRALEDAGQDEISRQWYRIAAKYQTAYYGQLAAAKLSEMGNFVSIAPPDLTPEDKASFGSSELVQAAKLFHLAGMRGTASDFLNAFANDQDNPKAYIYAIDLAVEFKHYHDAVRIAKNATKAGLFLTAQSYPVIADQLRNVTLEWALVHALIRQESVFNFEARSPAGALGLMQLMPATAKETARKMGIAHSTNMLTSNPAHNISLGSYFLNGLLERYDGAYPLAIAAYNAGPGRVDKWVVTYGDPRKGEIDIIDWIELIPIYETRNYVQRVIEGTYIYRYRLQSIQKPIKTDGMAIPANLRNF